MKETPLPIDIIETMPHKPDFHWAGYMLGILGTIIILMYLLLLLFSTLVLYFIPLESEEKYLGSFLSEIIDGEILDMTQFHYSLPEDKDYVVRIIESEEENAFASLGAQLMITRGLLDAVETQEELFFILGHEMMHLENRDPMRALLVHAPFSVSLSLLGFDGSVPMTKINEYFIKLKSREAEHLADIGGISLLKSLGANPSCAVGFFERNGSDNEKYLKLFSTHPVSQERINFIKSSAGEFGDIECKEMVEIVSGGE